MKQISRLSAQRLVLDFPSYQRCVRCDLPLSSSEYKGQKIAFACPSGYGCIRCFQRTSVSSNPDREKIIENFIGEKVQ